MIAVNRLSPSVPFLWWALLALLFWLFLGLKVLGLLLGLLSPLRLVALDDFGVLQHPLLARSMPDRLQLLRR